LRLQHELYIAQSEIATPPTAPAPAHRIEARHVKRLENELDEYTARVAERHLFVLPRGTAAGAALHVARTVARRGERELWALNRESPQRPELLQWMNRLSDLLFVLALAVNQEQGFAEVSPDYTV
jgi:cob(I)alamin adenosyltransferase